MMPPKSRKPRHLDRGVARPLPSPPASAVRSRIVQRAGAEGCPQFRRTEVEQEPTRRRLTGINLEMSRWMRSCVCVLVGLDLLFCGWLVPEHLRAVDRTVLRAASRQGPGVVERGLALANEHQVGPARLLWQAARTQALPGHEHTGRHP